MRTASELLRKYEIRPLKRLGQCFLVDPNIMAKIVKIADVGGDELVVEIGAGIGVMTALLAEKAKKVVAVEIDPVMVGILQKELQNFSNLEIVHQDVLKYEFRAALQGTSSREIKIVGNIPYNISNQILFRLINNRNIISEMILMFQKEVADRIVAEPGSKNYGILSVLTDMFAETYREISVPATCFKPAPNVDSAVLKIVFRENSLIELIDTDFFLKVVKASFAKRRKTLLNNLKTASFLNLTVSDLESALKKIGIDGGRRGETLSTEEFGKISNVLIDNSGFESRV
jgi:16S rRNA (adenine1518-N6/adenine1519-N6)-dimethyltransferase